MLGEPDPIQPLEPHQYFQRLCREIINQQLSSKAGDTIYQRFLQLFPQAVVTPQAVLALTPETIRAVGASNSKVKYIQSLAQTIAEEQLFLTSLSQMDDAAVIAALTQVKGIGRWTAEMFLIFTLGRPDVFSYGDLGLRKALVKLYNLSPTPTREEMERIVNRWSPHRSYAARLLWASLG